MLTVFARIAEERLRQRQLWQSGKLSCLMESPMTDDNRKLRVVMEEIGEVAKELDELEMLTRGRTESRVAFEARLKRRREFLREELNQTASVLVAWLESFESGTQEIRNGGGR